MPDNVMGNPGGGIDKGPRHEAGVFVATCCDVINLGERLSTMGKTPDVSQKIALVFQTSEQDDRGQYKTISAEFTNSLGPKATLRKVVTNWRGRGLEDAEMKNFNITDFAYLRGALLTIEHKLSKKTGKPYANILSIGALPPGFKPAAIVGYERAPFWEEKKKEYADEVAAWRRQQEWGAPATPKVDLNDVPGSLEANEAPAPWEEVGA